MKFDVCYTSVLKRAVKTLWTILEGTDQMWLPVHRTWRLNERHYGGLTGLNKAETAEKHGEEQVKIWRRSFDIPPPPMDKEHNYHKIISESRRYKELKAGELPTCESLKDTIARALPFWNDVVAPQIKAGKNVIIAAHGNSLRGIVKHLEGMSDAAIMELNLPTGIPIVYELDADLKPIKPMAFLGDAETVKKRETRDCISHFPATPPSLSIASPIHFPAQQNPECCFNSGRVNIYPKRGAIF